MTGAERAFRARDAAVTVAQRHGLRVDGAVLLADGQNVVVRLDPAPVIARVATMTAVLRADTTRPFGRELALAGALAAAGAAVVPPSDELPAGPHRQDGLTVSFWRHVDIRPEQPSPRDAGRALAELHEVLADLPQDLLADAHPLDTPLDDLAVFAERGTAVGADPRLAARVGELATALRPHLVGPSQLLHGDAHPGNLLATTGGWTWTDLEDCCRGQRAWDLACLAATRRLDGRAALAAMPHPPTEAEMAPFHWLRTLHRAAWWQVAALRDPGYATQARDLLTDAVAEVGAGLGS